MGIESEQLVFDYLSRVGDLAHGTSMTASERGRLVGGLRTEIERMRAAAGGAGSTAAVRKVLERLGTPEEVVSEALGGTPVGVPAGPSEEEAEPRPRVRLTKLPRMRRAEAPEAPPPSRGASPPHLAGIDELGPEESDPEWWRVSRRAQGGSGRELGYDIPDAFSGGIELPEVLERPPGEKSEDAPPAVGGAGASGGRSSVIGALKARRRKAAEAGPAVGGFVELAAAGLLVAAAVTGSLPVLGLGWLAAYWSPRLTPSEGQWAAFGIPGLTAAGCVVWLWGRTEGRWGSPLGAGPKAMQEALTGIWPVAFRVAAVAAAAYLVWRARRRPG
ncbi:hypothetical protein [Streptomyces sp. TR06-5]|uniref:hypothetical protein n=1 Tax=unclassified Streptomyces TaxID=2593676 RepID=UPI0039A23D3F